MVEYPHKENEKKPTSLYAFAPIALLAGGGIVSRWKTAASETAIVEKMAGSLGELLSLPFMGSLLVGVLGAITAICVIGSVRKWRGLAVMLLGYILDCSLSLAFFWLIRDIVITDPMSFWPFVLGALATFLAGIAVGIMAAQAPIRHALGLVALDFLIVAAVGFASPMVLSWNVASRIPVAYGCAILGAIIGQYIWLVTRTDRLSIGKFLGTSFWTLLTAVAGGLLTQYIFEYIG
jgi:hypothetical protein